MQTRLQGRRQEHADAVQGHDRLHGHRAEGQHVAQSLGVELTPAPGQGHFFAPYEPIFEAVMSVAEGEG